MKKISISFLMLALSGTLANSAYSTFNGLYTGAHVGYSHTRVKRDVKVDAPGVGSWHHHRSSRGDNLDLGLFLGFGGTLGSSNFYLGGETGIGYDRTHFKKNLYGHQVRAHLKPSIHYNFSGRLGYVLCTKNLIYGRVGFKGYTKKAKIHFVPTHHKDSFTRNGILLGAGYEFALSDHTLWRLEYQFLTGAHKTHKHTTNAFTAKTSHRAHNHTVLTGLSYKF